MERFVLSWKKSKNNRVHLLLEMRWKTCDTVQREWKVLYAGAGAQQKSRMFIRFGDVAGIWFNAEWENPLADPGTSDENVLLNKIFERDYDMGKVTLDHDAGMRFAMLMMIAGKINTLGAECRVVQELRNMPSEEVLYWFVKCAYGCRQKAARAALFAFLGTKGDRA